MKTGLSWALALLALFISPTVFSDYYSPSHSCSKPYKPYTFDTQWELDAFLEEVEQYKNCIEDFVEEQNEAAENHTDAAEEAISDWNDFVRYELE